MCELEDYVHQVEPIHFPKTVPQFQSGTSSAIQFPTGKELTSRGEWYDEHMPTLGSNFKDGETDVKVKDGNFKYFSASVLISIYISYLL